MALGEIATVEVDKSISHKRHNEDDQLEDQQGSDKRHRAEDIIVQELETNQEVIENLVSLKPSRLINKIEAVDMLKRVPDSSLRILWEYELKEASQKMCSPWVIKLMMEHKIGEFLHDMSDRLELFSLTREVAKYAFSILVHDGHTSSNMQLDCLVVLYVVAKQREPVPKLTCGGLWLNWLEEPVSVSQFLRRELEILGTPVLRHSNQSTSAHFLNIYASLLPPLLPACPAPDSLRRLCEAVDASSAAGPGSDVDKATEAAETKRFLSSYLTSLEVRRTARGITVAAINILNQCSLALLRLPPSLVAAAALYLARQSRDAAPVWPDCLVHLTGFRACELLPAICLLLEPAGIANGGSESPSLPENATTPSEDPATAELGDVANSPQQESSMPAFDECAVATEGESGARDIFPAGDTPHIGDVDQNVPQVPSSGLETEGVQRNERKCVSSVRAASANLMSGDSVPNHPRPGTDHPPRRVFHVRRNAPVISHSVDSNLEGHDTIREARQIIPEVHSSELKTKDVQNTDKESVHTVRLGSASLISEDSLPNLPRPEARVFARTDSTGAVDEIAPADDGARCIVREPASPASVRRQSPVEPIAVAEPHNFHRIIEPSLNSTHTLRENAVCIPEFPWVTAQFLARETLAALQDPNPHTYAREASLLDRRPHHVFGRHSAIMEQWEAFRA